MQALQYVIRDAEEADALPIMTMHAQSWLDTYPNEEAGITREWVKERTDRWFTEENMQKKRDLIERSKTDPDVMHRLAETSDGTIIGIATPYRTETVQKVGAIYVDKAYHGTGLAQVLMDEIIAWSDPTRPLELEVAAYNHRARAFYRKYNFEEVENSEHIVKDTIPVITMIRKGDAQ